MDLNDISNNPEQIKQLISLLQNLLPKTNEETILDSQEDEAVHKMPTRGQKSNGKRKQKSTNKFLTMREKDMHKEDSKVDRLLNKAAPVSRSRDFSFVKATCRVCGKTEEIAPGLLFEGPHRYKCNNCSTSSG